MPRTRTTRATTSTEPYAEPGLLLDIEVDPTAFNRLKAERRHPCSECSKAFTTSGHLARHMKTHTGERAHKCPFPGCNTTCSRQDNLQQHYRVHLSPTSKRASPAENRAAIARARAVPNSRRRRTRDSQDEDTSPVYVSQYNAVPEPPSPPSSPPPLGEAHPDILTGRRPANPLPSGEQPVPIFTTPTPEQAIRLGLPMPVPCVPGAAPPPQAWIRAPSGALVPYDEHRPYEALGYTNFQPYVLRAPIQASPEEQRQSWSVAPPSTPGIPSSSSMMAGGSSSSSMTLSPSYSTSNKRTSPPRAVYNPPQHLPSPPRTGCGRPGFEREVLEKQAQQARSHPTYTEPLHGHPYAIAPPPTASSISSTSTLPTHYGAAPQPQQTFAYSAPRPLQQETTMERFTRMAESIPPPPFSRGVEDPFRQAASTRGPALPPLRFREDQHHQRVGDPGLRLPPLGAPPPSSWPGHGVHVR